MLVPRTFNPRHAYRSALPGDLLRPSGTMASADSCSLSPTSRLGLPSQTAWQQVSPGKNVDFPCTLAPFTALALDCIGLHCLWPTHPASQPPMGFVSLKSQVCLRLPPDLASRRRPCPRLTVGAINPRKGLSPSSQRPCWAHQRGAETLCSGASNSTTYIGQTWSGSAPANCTGTRCGPCVEHLKLLRTEGFFPIECSYS